MSSQLLSTPSKHPFSVTGLVDRAVSYAREAAFHSASSPIVRVAEAVVVALMQKITHGRLRILTYSRIYTFPAPSDGAGDPNETAVELRVVNEVFWIRLLTMGDLGFSEAYMFGDVECDDLVGLFKIFLANRENLTEMNSAVSPLFSLMNRLTSSRFVNSIANSTSNISAHYDISNAMFESFLSEDMTYSCAIFDDLDGDLKRGLHDATGGEALARFGSAQGKGENGIRTTPSPPPLEVKDELHEAQIRKIKHIIRKADIRPGHRVLEIGSGWGTLAILAVQQTGCKVDTITLSVHQQILARERIAALGLSDQIQVHLMDYRSLPADWEGCFDRVISVEMIEAVGREFMDTYFSVIDWALKRKGAVAVIQGITIPEARFERYIREIDFIRKWVIFPGGFLPTVTLLLDATQRGSKGRLLCESITNIGPHYARTLREWRRRFQSSFDSHIGPAILQEHPNLTAGSSSADHELQVFKRKWLYYYCYCEVGFTNRILGDHIITFVREGAEDYSEVPFH